MRVLSSSAATALLAFQICCVGASLAKEIFDARTADSGRSNRNIQQYDTDKNDDSSSINFLAIGDWGGVGSKLLGRLPLHHFGSIRQQQVAVGLAQVAQEVKAEFMMGLGDNFYMTGVSNLPQAAIGRIQETFEDVYHHAALQIPFYTCAGNHDHYGNVTQQLEYTSYSRQKAQQPNASFVHRWEFPNLYHKKTIQRSNLTLDLIFIDTVTLEKLFYEKRHSLGKWLRGFSKLKYPSLKLQTQWQWLQTQLRESQADYLLVAGHYPVFNQGSHGPTATLVQHLRPLLEQYQAHYLSGHDHSMSHFVTTTSGNTTTTTTKASSQGTNYIITGAGNSCCSIRRPWYRKQHERDHPDVPLVWHQYYQDGGGVKGGFVSLKATPQNLQVKYHNQDGEVLYQADPILPRTKMSVIMKDQRGESVDVEIE